ncbi:hypothetical protein QQ045_032444 [Rhodiola kirilowii]
MAKEFKVPPVIFPSSGTPSNSTNERRQPQSPSIPFVTFDIGSGSGPTSLTNPLFIGPPIGVCVNFEDEPPLLNELGINTRQIWNKAMSILIPFKLNPRIHEDADLSSPFVLMMAFGLFQ